jgi:MFS family permease
LFWGAWAACLPAIQQATGASDAQLGLELLCVALAALPAMLVAGRLSDAFGAARLVPISLVFFGLVAVPGTFYSTFELKATQPNGTPLKISSVTTLHASVSIGNNAIAPKGGFSPEPRLVCGNPPESRQRIAG